MNEFAVFARRRYKGQGDVMVLQSTHEFRVIDNTNARLAARVARSDLQRAVGAAIVDNDVFPIAVGLPQDAFYARGQIILPVVYGR